MAILITISLLNRCLFDFDLFRLERTFQTERIVVVNHCADEHFQVAIELPEMCPDGSMYGNPLFRTLVETDGNQASDLMRRSPIALRPRGNLLTLGASQQLYC